jgi:hypothetical protein
MKPKLSEFAANVYSQLGEDGMLARLLEDFGVRHKTCAEFGAWDGLFCSNTAHLWRDQGWKSIQIEPNDQRFAELEVNVRGHDVKAIKDLVYPQTIDDLLSGIGPLDVLSIDVDGADWYLFDAMTITPRIVIIEYNQSIPPHLDIRQSHAGMETFSASALAIKKLAESKGYQVAGRSETNLFLVHESQGDPSAFYETEWDRLFTWDEYTYLIGDMTGNVTFVGRGPYWGHGTSRLDYPLRTDGAQPPWKQYYEFEQ